MSLNIEKIAGDFLELSSEQILEILTNLAEKKFNVSKLADILDATKPEVHRNVNRLVKAGLIIKDSDGNYTLTTYGKTALMQIPTLSFISENKKYFTNHTLGNLETKFIQRLEALHDKKTILEPIREEWSGYIYSNFGLLSSLNGALTTWATIAGDES